MIVRICESRNAPVFACLLDPTPDLVATLPAGLPVGLGSVDASFRANYQSAQRSLALLLVDGRNRMVQLLSFALVLELWR